VGPDVTAAWFPSYGNRTLADDLRDKPRPVDETEHVHFHSHDGRRHAHRHIHPEQHAHSSRTNIKGGHR